MLELKVSRCCELNDERQLSAILFIGKNCDSDEYIAVVVINDTLSPSYTAAYDQKSWKTLREEGECSTDEEFIAELADLKNSLSMERSECVQVKWIRPDEDGLMFEFCTLTLNLDTTKIYDIIDALLKERNIYHDNAVKGDTIVADMERRLELLGKGATNNFPFTVLAVISFLCSIILAASSQKDIETLRYSDLMFVRRSLRHNTSVCDALTLICHAVLPLSKLEINPFSSFRNNSPSSWEEIAEVFVSSAIAESDSLRTTLVQTVLVMLLHLFHPCGMLKGIPQFHLHLLAVIFCIIVTDNIITTGSVCAFAKILDLVLLVFLAYIVVRLELPVRFAIDPSAIVIEAINLHRTKHTCETIELFSIGHLYRCTSYFSSQLVLSLIIFARFHLPRGASCSTMLLFVKLSDGTYNSIIIETYIG
ncbi:hypothetical protein DINM_001323 [Dirofilaria immitis]|nr:hypothetical protein [Dirofilaria immitis]